MKTNLYIGLGIFSILFGVVDVHASFTVAPMRFEFQIEQGQTGAGSLIVRNISEKPVSVRIYIKDFKREPKGNESELDPGTVSRSCSEWISITPMNIDLEPGGRQNVRMSLTVPEDAHGTYWAMIWVEQSSKPDPRVREGSGYTFNVSLIPRWGVRIIANVPGTGEKNGEITNISISSAGNDKSLNVMVEFENTGNRILKCEGSIEIRDENGETVETIYLKKFSVYPDGKRVIKTEIPQTLKPGEYSALAVIDYEGEYLVAGEAFFEIP